MVSTAGDSAPLETAGDSSPSPQADQTAGKASRGAKVKARRGAKGKTGVQVENKAELKIAVEELKTHVEDWNLESQVRQHTYQSLQGRRVKLRKFFWFLEHRKIEEVGTSEIKQFFFYCSEGHQEEGGRWGNPRMTEPLRPGAIHGYYRILKALFNYLVHEEIIDHNPMQKVKAPQVRVEIKQPVSDEHVRALLRACKRSPYCRRDEAILLLLVDTGLRASELCGLTVRDLDLQNRSLKVLGKGNKYRTVYLGLASAKAMNAYLRGKNRLPDDPVFLSHTHRAFTASGVFQVMKRLSGYAGIKNPGVHALRRTFAVNLLRAGANVFAVQTLMGHSDLTMTRRYCKVADDDCAEQHRKFSPADQLQLRK